MNLEKLTIEGYKSIGKIEIVKPNLFTVFVGPNASGKSNIFEAIEFLEFCDFMQAYEVSKLFGGIHNIRNQANFTLAQGTISFYLNFGKWDSNIDLYPSKQTDNIISTFNHYSSVNRLPKIKGRTSTIGDYWEWPEYKHFTNFTRLFVGYPSRLTRNDDSRLNTDASNLEKVLKRILKNEINRIEIHETLQLLIPGFEKVEIVSSELSGRDDMIIYESHLKKPLTKEFISDGTFNIIAILAAIYQSDEPQFLCIEEPENGINPFVVKELVNIIRDICEEKGHYIWLNTHSQSLVSVLTKEEIIIVDKKNGLTEIKQIQDIDLHGLRMDDALYTNSIGGGNPW